MNENLVKLPLTYHYVEYNGYAIMDSTPKLIAEAGDENDARRILKKFNKKSYLTRDEVVKFAEKILWE